jgi:citrate lyase subunit beta/citryl-CoA lyase
MIRSLIFVPTSSERFVAKAHERGADAIILDLEDSVLPSQKQAARERLAEAVPLVGQKGAKVFVRVNSEDERVALDTAAACRAGAFGIVLPKANAAAVVRVAAILDYVERESGKTTPTVIVAILEDPAAVCEARNIGSASPRVFGLMCASEDLPTSMNAEPTTEFLRFPKLLVHFAAKAAGVRSFGLMRAISDFGDLEAVNAAIAEARSFGFDGATCVHPNVVPLLNRGFAPTPEQVDKAVRLLAAAEDAKTKGQGAFLFEGKMADEPVLQRARNLLLRHEQLQARNKS